MKNSRPLKFKLTKKHVEESEKQQAEFGSAPKPYCAICPVAICLEEKLDLPYKIIDDRKVFDLGVDGYRIRMINSWINTPINVKNFIETYDIFRRRARINFLELLPISFTLEIPKTIKIGGKRRKNEESLLESNV